MELGKGMVHVLRSSSGIDLSPCWYTGFDRLSRFSNGFARFNLSDQNSLVPNPDQWNLVARVGHGSLLSHFLLGVTCLEDDSCLSREGNYDSNETCSS